MSEAFNIKQRRIWKELIVATNARHKVSNNCEHHELVIYLALKNAYTNMKKKKKKKEKRKEKIQENKTRVRCLPQDQSFGPRGSDGISMI